MEKNFSHTVGDKNFNAQDLKAGRDNVIIIKNFITNPLYLLITFFLGLLIAFAIIFLPDYIKTISLKNLPEIKFNSLSSLFKILVFFGIVSIIAIYAKRIILFFKKFSGNIHELNNIEQIYLENLIVDLDKKNKQNLNWKNDYYVDINAELKQTTFIEDNFSMIGEFINQNYYVIKGIKPDIKEQDFNNLSNIEKIDCSRGVTFQSLEKALKYSQDNATVVIAPPGSGKTVSLRNIAIKLANLRLKKQNNQIPIFINLGYYTGFTKDNKIESFENFIENYVSQGDYQKFLSQGNWLKLLDEGRVIFIIDAIDEMPRNSTEYEQRAKNIQEFTKKFPRTHFILSCRELDYIRDLSFQQILIKPFESKHIKQFLLKYFTKKNYKKVFKEIKLNISIFELCKNPFYLNLIACFIREKNELPKSKAHIFNYITTLFLKREIGKNKTPTKTFQKDFFEVLSAFAFHIAAKKMVTTININVYYEYLNSFYNKNDFKKTKQYIEFAIKGGLLDFNSNTKEIRFIHNRFLEYFSSLFILTNYKQEQFQFPQNFLTNIWWRETVLFIAGLEDDVDYFIDYVLYEYEKIEHSNPHIKILFKLECLILAFECIFSNINIAYTKSRNYLTIRNALFKSYEQGNTLEKTKILNSLKLDETDEVRKFTTNALKDKSNWLSERAFFILSEGNVKLQLNAKNIIYEFWRFAIEGRIFKIAIPLFKSLNNTKLNLLTFPVFFFFFLFSIFIIISFSILFTIYSIDFVQNVVVYNFFHSYNYLLMTTYFIYFIANSNNSIIKCLIYLFPLLLFAYINTHIPNPTFFGIVLILIFSYFISYLAGKIFKKANEQNIQLHYVTFFVLGAIIMKLLLSTQLTIFESVSFKIDIYKYLPFNKHFVNFIGAISALIITIYLIYYLLSIALLYNKYKRYCDAILSKIVQQRSIENMVEEVIMPNLYDLKVIWAQKLFLIYAMQQLSSKYNRMEKIIFLSTIAINIKEIDLQDAVFQFLEEEERNYRRNI